MKKLSQLKPTEEQLKKGIYIPNYIASVAGRIAKDKKRFNSYILDLISKEGDQPAEITRQTPISTYNISIATKEANAKIQSFYSFMESY